jgi:mono/diheme cytochrome c family protein
VAIAFTRGAIVSLGRVAVVALLLAGRLTIAQSAPDGSPVDRGHTLFAGSCAYCHSQKGFATGLLAKRLGPQNSLLEARTDLTPVLIHTVVRHGINGMPWYRRSELSDAELDDIVSYLTRPRESK